MKKEVAGMKKPVVVLVKDGKQKLIKPSKTKNCKEVQTWSKDLRLKRKS